MANIDEQQPLKDSAIVFTAGDGEKALRYIQRCPNCEQAIDTNTNTKNKW